MKAACSAMGGNDPLAEGVGKAAVALATTGMNKEGKGNHCKILARYGLHSCLYRAECKIYIIVDPFAAV